MHETLGPQLGVDGNHKICAGQSTREGQQVCTALTKPDGVVQGEKGREQAHHHLAEAEAEDEEEKKPTQEMCTRMHTGT